MRRMSVVATTAALFMVASLSGMASAAAPDRVSDTQTELMCETLTADAGTASVYIGVSDAYGGYADLAFWASPAVQYQDPPTWVTTFGNAGLSPDGAALTATFDLAELVPEGEAMALPIGDPVGIASLAATLAPAGDPESFSDQGRDGNRRYTFEGTYQPLAADGALELPDGTVFDDLSGCWASRSTTEWFTTNPDTQVGGYADRSLSCLWEDESSSVGLYAVGSDDYAYSEVWLADATGFTYGFTESATLTISEFSADYVLETYDEFEDASMIVGSASAFADVRAGERFNDLFHDGTTKVRVKGQQLLVDGTLDIETASGSTTLVMDDGHCIGQDIELQFISTSPNPGRGPALPNDTPEGAVELVSGDAVQVRTAGAAEYPEAGCVVDDPGYGEIEIPLGKTVWYTVVGTGEPVTIDTAGSDFDTVLGVYTSDGSGLTQVVCVDDVFSEEGGTLQAAVTFDTEAGTTYLVQAGGYSGAYGTLKLSVS